MADFISKNRIFDLIHAVYSVHGFTSYEDYVGLLKDVETSTNADAQPVKHAKWILFAKDEIGRAFYCSNCRKATTTEDFENSPLEREEYFCSRCGARMDGEQNDT